jgi:hypothetical protein
MAERKFAALAGIRHRAERVQDVTPEIETSTPPFEAEPPPPAVRPLGRPPGKRSDPDWKPRTILMRTKTHRRVSGELLDQDEGPDLSELIDQLLTEWLEKQ